MRGFRANSTSLTVGSEQQCYKILCDSLAICDVHTHNICIMVLQSLRGAWTLSWSQLPMCPGSFPPPDSAKVCMPWMSIDNLGALFICDSRYHCILIRRNWSVVLDPPTLGLYVGTHHNLSLYRALIC